MRARLGSGSQIENRTDRYSSHVTSRVTLQVHAIYLCIGLFGLADLVSRGSILLSSRRTPPHAAIRAGARVPGVSKAAQTPSQIRDTSSRLCHEVREQPFETRSRWPRTPHRFGIWDSFFVIFGYAVRPQTQYVDFRIVGGAAPGPVTCLRERDPDLDWHNVSID